MSNLHRPIPAMNDYLARAGERAVLMVSLPSYDALRHGSSPHDWGCSTAGHVFYRDALVQVHDEWSWGWMVRKADGSFVEPPAQGIEAPSGGETTKIGSTEGESPVAESDAPE